MLYPLSYWSFFAYHETLATASRHPPALLLSSNVRDSKIIAEKHRASSGSVRRKQTAKSPGRNSRAPQILGLKSRMNMLDNQRKYWTLAVASQTNYATIALIRQTVVNCRL